MIPAHGPSAAPHFRYHLSVDVEPVDARVLRDALEDEPFGLRKRYGMPAIARMIEEHTIEIATSSTERWDDFTEDLVILSVYLSQYIVGYEIEVKPTAGAPALSAWKVVACRGESVRLDCDVLWDHREEAIELHEENVDALVDRWPDLPVWLQNAMRLKYPRLSAL